jgi:hypothetical protein
LVGVATALSVTTTMAQVQSPVGADGGRIAGHVITAYAERVGDATVSLAQGETIRDIEIVVGR